MVYPEVISTGDLDSTKFLSNSYELEYKNRGVVVTFKWQKRWGDWWVVPFAVGWILLAIVLWCLYLFSTISWVILPLPIVVIIAVLFGYDTALSLFNKTSITTTRQTLSVEHKPIPGKRGYTFQNTEIRDIQIITRKQYSFGVPVQSPVLQLLTLNGQKRDLIVGTDESDFDNFKILQKELRIAVGLEVVGE